MPKYFLAFLFIPCLCFSAPDPAAYRNDMQNNGQLKINPRGEDFCWHAAYGITAYVTAYQAYKDTKWLDEGVKYFDWLISKMEVSPDGYKGWVGPYEYDAKVDSDCHVGDGVLIREFLRFAEVVLKDRSIRAKYEDKAREYIELAKKHYIEKWDKRGTWYEYLTGAGYSTSERYIDQKTREWVTFPSKKLNLPFNKQNVVALVALRIYRITKEEFYRAKAEKLFAIFKSRFRYFEDEDRYVWNYWEPYNPWDIGSIPKHWVSVHPSRSGYQYAEIHDIAEAYHSGLVFEQKDLERIINTNLWMWNKDEKNPVFKSADGNTEAGCLWDGLVDFNAVLRALKKSELEKQHGASAEIELDYMKNVALKEPVSFKRKYVAGEVKIPAIPVYPMKDITAAVCIPDKIKAGERMKFYAGCLGTGNVQVDLFDETGVKLLGNILSKTTASNGGMSESWDGTSLVPEQKLKGRYLVKFSFKDSYKMCPVEIE